MRVKGKIRALHAFLKLLDGVHELIITTKINELIMKL